ncbi:hypothetical protein ACFL35_06670 [Candidatus Riflebacteria bacterium]
MEKKIRLEFTAKMKKQLLEYAFPLSPLDKELRNPKKKIFYLDKWTIAYLAGEIAGFSNNCNDKILVEDLEELYQYLDIYG